MAYDHYVAICLPLLYHQILSQRNCTLITIGIWASAFLNSLILVSSVFFMSSCHSNVIRQFFCHPKALTKNNCTGPITLFAMIGIEMMILVFIPFVCTLVSYVKIFSVIFKMKLKESKKKALSTCSSHITIMTIYYGTGLLGYVIPSNSDVLELVGNTIFTAVIPMLNPIIYSLQNSNVQSALMGLVWGIGFLKNREKIKQKVS
ncbi:olfactory receptor 8H1-like [Dendrobates tinctorius]|uniref:olfactory receptor 8H1-like n=1 Tax=Dendrobates tinctorius TaxID=92724 RepID=UPI003CCA28FA